MTITREFLEKEIASLDAQGAEHLATIERSRLLLEQVRGAKAAFDAILKLVKEVSEFDNRLGDPDE
jgi:hypothetical protein